MLETIKVEMLTAEIVKDKGKNKLPEDKFKRGYHQAKKEDGMESEK